MLWRGSLCVLTSFHKLHFAFLLVIFIKRKLFLRGRPMDQALREIINSQRH